MNFQVHYVSFREGSCWQYSPKCGTSPILCNSSIHDVISSGTWNILKRCMLNNERVQTYVCRTYVKESHTTKNNLKTAFLKDPTFSFGDDFSLVINSNSIHKISTKWNLTLFTFHHVSNSWVCSGGCIPIFMRIEGAHLPTMPRFPQISGLTEGSQKHHYPVLLP